MIYSEAVISPQRASREPILRLLGTIVGMVAGVVRTSIG
jgi:hypothetical protein